MTAQPAASHHPLFFQEPGWLLTLSQKEAANEDLESEAASLRAKVDSLETESLSLVAKITGAEAELSTCRSCCDNLRREVRLLAKGKITIQYLKACTSLKHCDVRNLHKFADGRADSQTGRGARRECRSVQDGLRATEVDPRGDRSHFASVVCGRRQDLRGTPRLFGQIPAQVARRKGRSRAQGRRMIMGWITTALPVTHMSERRSSYLYCKHLIREIGLWSDEIA